MTTLTVAVVAVAVMTVMILTVLVISHNRYFARMHSLSEYSGQLLIS